MFACTPFSAPRTLHPFFTANMFLRVLSTCSPVQFVGGGAVCAGNKSCCDALCTHTAPCPRPPLPNFHGKHAHIYLKHNRAGAHLHGMRCVCDKQILLQGTQVPLLCFTLLHPCPPTPSFPGMMVHLTKDKVPEASACCRELCMGGTQLACQRCSCTVCTMCSNHAHLAPCNGV